MARVFAAASSQYVQTSAFQNPTAPLTLACWIRPTTTSGFQRAMTWSASGTGQVAASVLLNYPSAGNVSSQVYGGMGNILPTASGTFATNTWHHVACVTESLRARCYLDGSAGSDGTWATQASWSFSTYLSLGRADNTASQYYDGRIADAAVWSVALTAAEVQAMASGLRSADQIRPDALVAYWPLGGLRPDNDRDQWGKAYDLTAVNSPTSADGPPLWYPDDVDVVTGSAATTKYWLLANRNAAIIG